MAINTILLDLSVDPLKVLEKYTFQSTIQDVLSKFLPELKETHSTDFKNGGFVTTFTAVRDSFVTVRSFPKGLVAINIEYYRDDGEEPLLSFEVSFTSSFSSKGTFSSLRGILRCMLRWISFHAAVVGAPCKDTAPAPDLLGSRQQIRLQNLVWSNSACGAGLNLHCFWPYSGTLQFGPPSQTRVVSEFDSNWLVFVTWQITTVVLNTVFYC